MFLTWLLSKSLVYNLYGFTKQRGRSATAAPQTRHFSAQKAPLGRCIFSILQKQHYCVHFTFCVIALLFDQITSRGTHREISAERKREIERKSNISGTVLTSHQQFQRGLTSLSMCFVFHCCAPTVMIAYGSDLPLPGNIQ